MRPNLGASADAPDAPDTYIDEPDFYSSSFLIFKISWENDDDSRISSFLIVYISGKGNKSSSHFTSFLIFYNGLSFNQSLS